MIFSNINKDTDGFYTFETSWIGQEKYDFINNTLKLPILNLEVDNEEVLKYLNIEKGVAYIRESYFLFEGMYKLEKNTALQTKEMGFIADVVENIIFKNATPIEEPFEFGGMGVNKGYIYDGLFKIYAEKCSYIINENSPISLDFIGMNDFDPFTDSWLNETDWEQKIFNRN